ncbi:MAG: ATP-binding protein, partial [Chthoniobacterales bacterium]
MTFRLRDTPIQQKLTLVILLTSSFALLLMGSALITYELVTFRRSLETNMGVLAQIIGSNSTAALAFDDPKGAQEILNALAAEKQVTAAAIYDNSGAIFASFPENKAPADLPTHPAGDGHMFAERQFMMFQPILQEGKRLGTIFVRADLTEMYSRLTVYGTLIALVAACSFLGALVLSRTLQRHISQPILALANVATAVSERQDYSVRAVKHGSDELGQLTDAFNEMLTRIGESNAALAGSEERLRLALEGSQTGTWDWNLVTGKLIWDDYMYPLYGRSREEFEVNDESAVVQLIHPEDRVNARNATQWALDHRQDLDMEYRIIFPDGSVRHMATRGRAFYDEKGQPVRMAGVNLDVTRTKQTEEDLSRAKEAAEAANKAKDNFLAILSHELRTPLTPVLAAVASLQDDESVPQHIARELEMIRRNVEVEARLIDDLLDVTGMVRGKIELNRQIVDVRPLLEHAMQNYCAGVAQRKNLRVSTEISAKETHVLADSSRMTQVFWNLLQNACKFTPNGGSIDVRVYNETSKTNATGNDVVVVVSDTGIGITPENMPRIFNAFEQGERSRTRIFGGLGLGLAISRAIVELHEGEISAESEGEGKGTTIVVRLSAVPAPAAISAERPQAPSSASAEATRRLHVLLVEDHLDTADQIARLLQRAGHEVTTAGSLTEAREVVAEATAGTTGCPFDILVSDLGLPDGNGQDLMRDLGACRGIAGIALSGFGMKEDVEASLAAGFSRHMTKPVDWRELKSAIETLAEQ